MRAPETVGSSISRNIEAPFKTLTGRAMPKKLSKHDIRAAREYLVNDDFALAEGPEFVPLGNIAPDVWNGIMGLPDDVAIRTTDFRTAQVEHAHKVAMSWLNVAETLADGPLQTQTLAVFEAFDASLFNAVTGWYRTAGLTLRAGVDDLLTGLYFQVKAGQRDLFAQIITGAASSPQFKQMRATLLSLTNDAVFEYPGGDFGALYDTLSIYTHRISNAEIWQSNGPIYVDVGFDRWFNEYMRADKVLNAAITAVIAKL